MTVEWNAAHPNWKILLRKRRNADCDHVLVDRGVEYENSTRWVVATVNSESLNNGEWFWGNYFGKLSEAATYFESLTEGP